jgi:hypothetical protein
MNCPEEKHNGEHWEYRCKDKVMRVRKENEQQGQQEGRGRDSLPRVVSSAHSQVNSCAPYPCWSNNISAPSNEDRRSRGMKNSLAERLRGFLDPGVCEKAHLRSPNQRSGP